MQGKIIKGIAGFYYVHAEDGQVYACRARGIFRKDKYKPLVGDDVVISVTDKKDMEGSLDLILPRKSELIRPAVSNVDQALVIFAAADPAPNLVLLDRFLVMMEYQKVPSVICFNKADLIGEEDRRIFSDMYAQTGYPIVFSSTRTGEGLQEIQECLAEKTTVVAGPSGAGKSSIANSLQSEIRMETGEISKKLGRGRHTTRHAQIIPLGDNTYLVDTPGFSSIFLPEIGEEELWYYLPEFREPEKSCRFQGCRHISEPDCGVLSAVREGKISRSRYDSYVLLHEELKEAKKY
ncbi:MAG: ribosome small subunit-dependent GTPase A [Blautia sp.]|nr:ribosome small subunit-dependent GTPase A [Blautia sp.]